MQEQPYLLDHLSDASIKAATEDSLQTTHGLFFHTRSGTLEMLTAHGVSRGPRGQIYVDPGNVLRPQDEEEILKLLLGRRGLTDRALNTPDVLYRAPNLLVWWLPPIKRPMYLRTHGAGVVKITPVWPNLVAAVAGRTLHLVACEGSERPQAGSRIYHAPLGNVYANTAVCTGDARLPEGATMDDKARWEAVIFDSAFTHTNHLGTLANDGQGINADADYWMARTENDQPFPDHRLNPLVGTLASWIESLNDGVN